MEITSSALSPKLLTTSVPGILLMTHLSLNYIVAICIWANEELPLASRIDLYMVWGGGGGEQRLFLSWVVMAAMASSICRENVALSRKNTFHVYKIISRENYLHSQSKKNTNLISDPKEQVNYLAESLKKKLLLPKLF